MFNIALCDDERIFLDLFKGMVEKSFLNHGYEIKIDVFTEGQKLIEQVEMRDKKYDIIFLDIRMPDLSGYFTAEKLREVDSSFCLIFTTQVKTIAKEIFKYEAFRFVSKYTLKEDLEEAVESYLKRFKFLIPADEEVAFTCVYGNEAKDIKVKKKDILYLKKVNRRVWMRTKYMDYQLQTYPMSKYHETLGKEHFIIVRRKYCVNLAQVMELKGDYFVFYNNESLSIGSTLAIKRKTVLEYGKYKSKRGGNI